MLKKLTLSKICKACLESRWLPVFVLFLLMSIRSNIKADAAKTGDSIITTESGYVGDHMSYTIIVDSKTDIEYIIVRRTTSNGGGISIQKLEGRGGDK